MKSYSIWKDLKNKECKKITQDMKVDVLIIGGGITGISTLYQLKNNGLNVILVERNKCGEAVTAKSTAKITYLQEKIYMKIRNLVGYDAAKKYLESQVKAVDMLKNIIIDEKIDCDLSQVDSYLFTNDDANIEKIEVEYKFLKDENIQVVKEDAIPFDIRVKKALKVSDTYVFHPLKYILALKEKFSDKIYENSKVEKIKKDNDLYQCLVNNHIIRAKYVVIATHYPYFLFPFLTPFKTHIETSYIGAKKVNSFKNISAINIDKPCISLRYHSDGTRNYLIYLYQSMMSCNVKNIENNFWELKRNEKFDYIWSNKDIITNDYMPYIGRIHENNNQLLMAFGYNTWGFTNGTMAGKIITDIILGNKNPYEEIFSPNRHLNLSKIVRLPIDLGSSVKAIIKSSKNNENNKQIVYKKIDGENVLIYTDENGCEHIVYDRCPHMKCGIIFNQQEKTWECLCHGSRFDIDGKAIEGPSNYDITFKK